MWKEQIEYFDKSKKVVIEKHGVFDKMAQVVLLRN